VKIIAGTTLTLTNEQQFFIENFWNQHGALGRAMLCQPRYRKGEYKLKLSVLDEAATDAVADVLEKCDRPKKEVEE